MLTMSMVVLAVVFGQTDGQVSTAIAPVAECVAPAQTSGPADALNPRNYTAEQARIEQLDREVAQLRDRLARLEARQGVQQTVYLPPPNWTPVLTAPLAPGFADPTPVPPPQDLGQEINGVKFRMFLLGGDDTPRKDERILIRR